MHTCAIYRRGCGYYWKRAIRSLTVPLRGRPLSSPEASLLPEVVLVVVVVGVVTGGEVGLVKGCDVGVVDLVTGGYVGVEVGRVVGLVTCGVVDLVTV